MNVGVTEGGSINSRDSGPGSVASPQLSLNPPSEDLVLHPPDIVPEYHTNICCSTHNAKLWLINQFVVKEDVSEHSRDIRVSGYKQTSSSARGYIGSRENASKVTCEF